jgi:hypothetical protein
MDNTKKLLLVDPNKAAQLYRPTISDKKLGALDLDISDILNSDLPDDEKAKRYIIALKAHRKYESPAVPTKPDPDTDIIKSIQPELRIKAKRLLKHIKPHVTFSDKGELVHDANLVDDSDITELLSETLSKNSEEKPIGWIEFADTLKRAHTPRHLIKNEKLWKYLNPRSKKTISKRKWLHL